MDFQYFYHQPLTNTGLADKKRLIASNNNFLTIDREKTTTAVITLRNESNTSLKKHDLIEMLDMTVLFKKKLFNSFYNLTSDLKNIEAVVKGKVQHLFVFIDDK